MFHFSLAHIRSLFLLGLAAGLLTSAPARAQGTAFTYQGRLDNAGVPASGLFDFKFALWDAATGGNVLNGGPICVDNIAATNGLITIPMDFGASFATTATRWLEVQVRADTGQACSTGAGYVTLTPRQQITPAPAATHANSAFALDAPDGSPTSAVSVDNAGNVGIGTTAPARKLTVAGDMEMGTTSSDYRSFRIGGGNSSGFLYGSYPAYGDGIHIGYNYFADAAGFNRIIATDGQTSRISMGYGYVALATGAVNTIPTNRLTVVTSGNVGVGTGSPVEKLDVRGNIKLGASGQYYAPAGEENLRIIRGVVDANGNAIVGSGFTVHHDAPVGFYHVDFTTPFSGPPTVTITVDGSNGNFAFGETDGVVAEQFELFVRTGGGGYTNGPFHFIAVGPR